MRGSRGAAVLRLVGLAALACVAAALTGCVAGPKYQRPAIESPEAHRGAVSAPEAASLADRPWWEIFPDEALKTLLDEALRNNYDVRIAAARVEEFRARAGIARSELYPQLQYSGGVLHGRQSDFAPGGVENSPTGTVFSVNLGLSWEIDLWGRVRRLSEAALARYLATEDARRGVLLSVVSQVAQGYFELRSLDERLAIARRTTEAFQGTFDLFNHQLTGGVASGLEVARAEAALGTAASAAADLERQVTAQENRLSYLVGRDPGPISRPPAVADEGFMPPEIPAGIPSALLERRPDIRSAEQQLVVANADVGEAIAEFFPTISLTAAFGGLSPELSTLFQAGKSWSFGAGLTGPLFRGARLRDQYRVNVALFQQAEAQYESTVKNAFGEVSTALVAHQKLQEVERQQARSVAAYREAVRIANIRYVAGLSSYIEVLDAEQQLFPAENALADTRLARLSNFVQVYRALGGGWNRTDPAWLAPAASPR